MQHTKHASFLGVITGETLLDAVSISPKQEFRQDELRTSGELNCEYLAK
jgi:hypothetical protein